MKIEDGRVLTADSGLDGLRHATFDPTQLKADEAGVVICISRDNICDVEISITPQQELPTHLQNLTALAHTHTHARERETEKKREQTT